MAQQAKGQGLGCHDFGGEEQLSGDHQGQGKQEARLSIHPLEVRLWYLLYVGLK